MLRIILDCRRRYPSIRTRYIFLRIWNMKDRIWTFFTVSFYISIHSVLKGFSLSLELELYLSIFRTATAALDFRRFIHGFRHTFIYIRIGYQLNLAFKTSTRTTTSDQANTQIRPKRLGTSYICLVSNKYG